MVEEKPRFGAYFMRKSNRAGATKSQACLTLTCAAHKIYLCSSHTNRTKPSNVVRVQFFIGIVKLTLD